MRKTRTARTLFHRDGVVYVLALLLICIFSSLAVAFISTTDLALCKGNNSRLALDARLAVESGMNYLEYVITSNQLPPGSTGQQALDELATVLSDELDGSANMAGGTISYDGSTITIPEVTIDGQQTFSAEMTLVSGNIQLNVTGSTPVSQQSTSQTVSRSASLELEPDYRSPTDYGIYSKGPVAAEMNFDFLGANEPEEGSIYSAAGGDAVTIDSGYVDGDVSMHDPDAVIDCGATVNGDIEIGVPEVPAPTLDGSIFELFATHTIDGSVDTTASDQTYENITIAAGTNPEFGNNTTIRGVMYVEAPNNVTFANNVDFTGVIVTEDPGEGADPALHRIYFNNNITLKGVDELPDSDEFEGLKEYQGSAVVAPGFALEFKNNFSSISGMIAVKSLVVKNNLQGTVYGSIIILGDGGMNVKNNASLTIDQSKYNRTMPGLVEAPVPVNLVVRPSSYSEGS